MTTIVDNTSLRLVELGRYVSRATAALPASADDSLFTVTGQVLLTTLVGEVTTVIETQLNNTLIKFNPTGTGADTDLCAALDITGDAVGTQYSLTGTVTDAMTSSLWVVPASDLIAAPGIYLNAGVIELECSATNTGSVAWACTYIPISADGAVVAA